MSRNGYDVVQNPGPKPNGTRPDYLVEGRYFDNVAPSTDSARNIWSRVEAGGSTAWTRC